MSPEERLVNILREKKYHVSFAESCTGGLVAATLVSVTDASSVFCESVVTYSSEAKIKRLGVKKEVIDFLGVVSEDVAGAMAQGVCNLTGAEVGVGITGIAGPSGGTPDKPVGIVCFGFCINGKVVTKTVNFEDVGRNNVRKNASTYVFRTLSYLLENEN
ncbi:MAG: CinA family protein [Clostridia bacterium]|nr:CinA family protein [Clostridia bacterium]